MAGALDASLYPAQERFLYLDHNLPLDVSCYQGGYGSGKTFSGSLLGMMLCLEHKGIKGLVGALNLPLLKRTTLQDGYLKHIRDLGWNEGVEYKHSITDSAIYFNNGANGFKDGSCLYFVPLEEPEKLKSLEVGFIELEEMSQIPESTYKQLLGRLRQTRLTDGSLLKQRRLFGHTNPEPAKGWIYKVFVDRGKYCTAYYDTQMEEEFKYEGDVYKSSYRYIEKTHKVETDGYVGESRYRLIVAPTTQNFIMLKHNPTYLTEMKANYDPEYYRVNVLGEFGDYTTGLVTKGFNRDKQVFPTIEINQRLPLHLSCDFNVDPMCWVILQVDSTSLSYIDEMAIEGGTNLSDSIAKFSARYPVGSFPHIILNGDASGQTRSVQSAVPNQDCYDEIEAYLSSRGYVVTKHLNNRNPNKFFRAQAWNARIRNALGDRNIFISERCEKLLYAIENLKWKPGTSDFDKPSISAIRKDSILKFMEHIFDAASYPAHYYFPTRQEKMLHPEEFEEPDITIFKTVDY